MVKVRAEAKGDGWVCEVLVDRAGLHTRHVVTVNQVDLDRWGGGTQREDVETLVGRSFDFLLEREPASSILTSFDLSVIQSYFPEYDSAFRRRP